MTEQSKKMIIYNLFPSLAGKCNKWEVHLKRASEMGFNWIFVNPIQYPGFSGSLYSIKDYFRFNPLFINDKSKKSPLAQIKETNKKANELGLRVMIDLVINHCAIDSGLIKEHPGWFLREKNGKVAHPFCDENGKKVIWADLAQIDHRNTKDGEGVFQFFLKVVNFLIELGFTGFRCDAAYQIPQSFWKRLICETKSKARNIIFLAETLGCPSDQTRKTAEAGFDYIFNSSKWWDFQGHWLMEQYSRTREIAPSISFPESHDTARLCEELNGNVDGLKQRYLFSTLFSTGVMAPIGFEFGFRKKLHVVKSTPGDMEDTDINITSFIKRVNNIKSRYDVFQYESATEILHNNNPNILVMWKASTKAKEETLIILNKDIHNKQHFNCDNLQSLVQTGDYLIDVSPEYPLDYVPAPFHYELRPGQGIVLVTA